MPSVWCFEERRYAKQMEVYISEFGDSDTVPTASVSLLLFVYPYIRLWFIDRKEFWCRGVDFEVHRRTQGKRRLIVPSNFVYGFVISPLCPSEVILLPSMVENDAREGPITLAASSIRAMLSVWIALRQSSSP